MIDQSSETKTVTCFSCLNKTPNKKKIKEMNIWVIWKNKTGIKRILYQGIFQSNSPYSGPISFLTPLYTDRLALVQKTCFLQSSMLAL